MRFAIKIFLFITFISTNIYAQSPAQNIPAFDFYRLNKSVFTNKDLDQIKMKLFVFFDSDCDHCRHAISEINKHFREFNKTGIYLVTLDDSYKINQFMIKYGPNLIGNSNVIMLQDLKNEFIQKFGPRKYPSIFLYSPNNRLLRYDDNEKNIQLFLQEVKKYGRK